MAARSVSPPSSPSKKHQIRFTKSDQEVFYQVRRVFWPEGPEKKPYDPLDSKDVWAFCVTMGYKEEKDRLKTTVEVARKIVAKRKEWNLPMDCPAEYYTPEWKYSIPLEEMESEWKVLCYGRTRNGHLVLWDKVGAMSKAFNKKLRHAPDVTELATQYSIYTCENSCRVKQWETEKHKKRAIYHVAVLDMGQTGVSTVSKMKKVLQGAMGDIQLMYPETVLRLYLVNTGWLFRAAWAIISMFVHPKTQEKIHLLGASWKKELAKKEGISKIPTCFGGKGDGKDEHFGGRDNLMGGRDRVTE